MPRRAIPAMMATPDRAATMTSRRRPSRSTPSTRCRRSQATPTSCSSIPTPSSSMPTDRTSPSSCVPAWTTIMPPAGPGCNMQASLRAPKDSDSEKIDYNALELDPDCAPAGYFSFPTSYANQGWPVWVSSSCPPGEYNLKFRVKSNHDVYCTMKFIVSASE